MSNDPLVKELDKTANNIQLSATQLQTGLTKAITDLRKRNPPSPYAVHDIFKGWRTDMSDKQFADVLQNDTEMLYNWYIGLKYPSFDEKHMAMNIANTIMTTAKKLKLDLNNADISLSLMKRDLYMDLKFWEWCMRKEGLTEEEIETAKAKRAAAEAAAAAQAAAVTQAAARASGSGSSGRASRA